MSTSLRLLPVRPFSGCDGFSHTILDVPGVGVRGVSIREAISALCPERIPATLRISSYVGKRVPDGSAKGNLTYGFLGTDAFGEEYTWIRARRLAIVLRACLPQAPATAYVEAMPGDEWIVLDWH